MSRLAPPTEADEKGEQKRIQVEPERKSDRRDRKMPRMRRRWRWRRERRCSRWEGSRRRPRPHPPSLVGRGSTASLTRTATCRSGETLNFSDCINGQSFIVEIRSFEWKFFKRDSCHVQRALDWRNTTPKEGEAKEGSFQKLLPSNGQKVHQRFKVPTNYIIAVLWLINMN